MRFTAIDFETANAKRSSACSIGLCFVDDGKIVGCEQHLIRPEPFRFDPMNTSIHGITEADVAKAPTFGELWPSLVSKIVGPLVAHNASFDMSVLRHALDLSRLSYPYTDYFCTLLLSRLTWPDRPAYSLSYVAQFLGVSLQHHVASDDAKACAHIALRACEVHDVSSLHDLDEACGLSAGSLHGYGYVACSAGSGTSRGTSQNKRLRACDIIPEVDDFDESHPFCGKSFAFTGMMVAMPRWEAMQAVADRGGECHDSVKRGTDFLVLGQAGFVGYCEGHKSGKIKKAEALLKKGHQIEILSEDDFVKTL